MKSFKNTLKKGIFVKGVENGNDEKGFVSMKKGTKNSSSLSRNIVPMTPTEK